MALETFRKESPETVQMAKDIATKQSNPGMARGEADDHPIPRKPIEQKPQDIDDGFKMPRTKQEAAQAVNDILNPSESEDQPAENLDQPEEESMELEVEETLESQTEQEAEPEPEVNQEESVRWTVPELAEAMGLPVEDVLKHIQIDDQTNLNDLREGQLRAADYTRKTQELAEQRQSLESETQSKQAEIGQRLTEAVALVESVEGELLSEYNKVNWEELKAEDEGAYAARQLDFQNRYNSLQGVKSQAMARVQEQSREAEGKQSQATKDYVENQRQLLADKMPEWSDPIVSKKINSDLSEYLIGTHGFTQEELSVPLDHRTLIISHKAMLYDQLEKSKPELKKKLRKAPKLIKPGAKPQKVDPQLEARSSAIKTFQSKKDKKSAAAVVNLMFKE